MTLTAVPDPDDDFATPDPHDPAAEQAVLGSMLLSARAAAECMALLGADDFYRPAHQVVFAAIRAMTHDGQNADAVTLLAWLDDAGETRAAGGAPYLHTLIASVPSVANADHYARIVRDRAVRRRLLEAGRRITQMARAIEGDAHGLTERAVREAEAARDAGLADNLTAPTITEFLEGGSEEYDWVVPGLLERGDRMILTGTEGGGKSTLFRQGGVMIAAGLHPFTGQAIKPQRVLLVDCENGAAHTRRKLRPLVLQAAAEGHPVRDANLFIEVRPEGMDLAADKDVSRLLRLVGAVAPDVLMIGPLYRLAPRALNDDSDAAPVLAALNMVRARGACVLLEAHAGHGVGVGGRRDLRPRGSSAFLGWPEFGYGIRRSELPEVKNYPRLVDVVWWRGDRDEREWPAHLRAGGKWPWSAHTPVHPVDDDWTPHSAADR